LVKLCERECSGRLQPSPSPGKLLVAAGSQAIVGSRGRTFERAERPGRLPRVVNPYGHCVCVGIVFVFGLFSPNVVFMLRNSLEIVAAGQQMLPL
jgi:hypothetical protein